MSYNRSRGISDGGKRRTRVYGAALVVVFALIPVVFIFFYYRAAIADAAESLYMAQVEPVDEQPDMQQQQNVPPQQDILYLAVDPTRETPAEQLDAVANEDEPDEPDEPEEELTGTVYLTFDDGPSRAITPGILDILLEEGINATFFTLPYAGVDDLFQRMIDEGHEIGNHSFSHDYDLLYKGSVNAFREDVLKARRYISDNFGYTTEIFRFPGGSTDTATGMSNRDTRNPRVNAIRDIGYKYFDWDIDPRDAFASATAENITNIILDEVDVRYVRVVDGKRHVIILLHDFRTREATLEALPGIIEGLRERGYKFDVLRNYPG